MFVGEAVDAFEFYDRHLLHQNVSVILPDVSALVRDWKPSLCFRTNAAEAEFLQQSAFVNFLEESSAQRVGDFKTAASTRSVKESKESAPTEKAAGENWPRMNSDERRSAERDYRFARACDTISFTRDINVGT